jgi:hypothetical protein
MRDSIIEAWIKDYQGGDPWRKNRADCHQCGWPHAANLLCGGGSTFASVRLGENTYYVDGSNVDFMLAFVKKLPSGFHWKNEVFFEVKDGRVIVWRIEPYNNCPRLKKWEIPLREWQSITDFVRRQTE